METHHTFGLLRRPKSIQRIALVTTLMATWGLTTECHSQTLVDLVQELEPAVFEIHSFGEDGLPSASGTGFIIDNEAVHALVGFRSRRADFVAAEVPVAAEEITRLITVRSARAL